MQNSINNQLKGFATKHLVQTKHQRKTSEPQKDKLIEFFEAHPDAQQIVSANNTDSEVKKKIWLEVANRLNIMAGGVQKTPLKWGKTWADMKLYTKNRAKGAISGTLSLLARRPTDLDKRMLRAIGQIDLLSEWEQAIIADNKKLMTNAKVERHVQEHDYEYEYLYDEVEESVVREYEVDDANASHGNKSVVHIIDDYQYLSDSDVVEIIDSSNPERNKRKIHIQSEETDSNSETKRICQESEENNSNNPEAKDILVASALNTLADAMNNVANALLGFSDVIRTFQR